MTTKIKPSTTVAHKEYRQTCVNNDDINWPGWTLITIVLTILENQSNQTALMAIQTKRSKINKWSMFDQKCNNYEDGGIHGDNGWQITQLRETNSEHPVTTWDREEAGLNDAGKDKMHCAG